MIEEGERGSDRRGVTVGQEREGQQFKRAKEKEATEGQMTKRRAHRRHK